MIIEINDDSVKIISENAADVTYLIHISDKKIKFEMDVDTIRTGFHDTEEREVRVTLTRVEE